MKTILLRPLALGALLAISTAFARADAASYAQILKERDDVLSQILADHENRFATGLVDDEAVFAARHALYSFRRDTAASPADKIKHQEMIVSAYEKRLVNLKGRARAGTVASIDLLRATDAVLEARQVLEELRLGKQKV